MVLLNGDIVLAFRDPVRGEGLAKRVDNIRLATCNMVITEILSLKPLDKSDAFYFAELFATMSNLPFDDEVTKHAIEIRRAHDIQLPDAIVAATAIANDVALWSHNTAKYKGIRHLQLHDPLAV